MIYTQYHNASDNELADLFHSSNWNNLSHDEKLAACQEVANRDALAHGMTPVEVEPSNLRCTQFGYYSSSDGKIHTNESVLNNGTILCANGEEIAYAGSNAETLNTIFHENSHAYDAQLSQAISDKQNGFSYNSAIIEDAESRGIDIDLARASDTIYVPFEQNTDAYRVQYCEKRAYENGEKNTAEFFEKSEAHLGRDEEYAAYTERLEDADSYYSALNNLKTVYGDDSFDKTMNEQTKDIFFADHREDSVFQYGTSDSRQDIRSMLDGTHGARLVSFYESNNITNEHYSEARADSASQYSSHSEKDTYTAQSAYGDDADSLSISGESNDNSDAERSMASSNFSDHASDGISSTRNSISNTPIKAEANNSASSSSSCSSSDHDDNSDLDADS